MGRLYLRKTGTQEAAADPHWWPSKASGDRLEVALEVALVGYGRGLGREEADEDDGRGPQEKGGWRRFWVAHIHNPSGPSALWASTTGQDPSTARPQEKAARAEHSSEVRVQTVEGEDLAFGISHCPLHSPRPPRA